MSRHLSFRSAPPSHPLVNYSSLLMQTPSLPSHLLCHSHSTCTWSFFLYRSRSTSLKFILVSKAAPRTSQDNYLAKQKCCEQFFIFYCLECYTQIPSCRLHVTKIIGALLCENFHKELRYSFVWLWNSFAGRMSCIRSLIYLLYRHASARQTVARGYQVKTNGT